MARIESYFSESSRCRAYFCTTYPEHFNNVVEDIFKPLKVESGVYILHDKDVDNNNNLKKAHYHLYMNMGDDTNQTIDKLAKFLKVDNIQFNDLVINKPVQPVRKNQKACEDYMLHRGYDGFHYAKSELKFYNCSSADDSQDIDSQLHRLYSWIDDCHNQGIHYTKLEFLKECLNLGFGKWTLYRSAFFNDLYQREFDNKNFREY